MEEKFRLAVEDYQCSGCISGCDVTCFEPNQDGGVGCGKHYPGTMIFPGVGKIFLGMPKGFNRLGPQEKMRMFVYDNLESSEREYDKFNIPAWKHLTKDGHTFVRGLMPRRNEAFLHVYLEDCMDKINCQEITEEDIKEMD